MVSRHKLGVGAEKQVANRLSYKGYFVRRMPYNSAFDLLVEDKRVEVKCARPGQDGQWVINIHRHGKLDESKVDVYIVRLEGIPGHKKAALHLLFPAPLNVHTLKFSFASLLRDYQGQIDNWQLLGTPSRKEVAA